MNKQQYMSRLAEELAKLPEEEIRAALEFYEEYFAEAGPENEAEVIAELGRPEQAAAQIKADYAVKQMDAEDGKRSPKKGVTAVVWVVLAIFAAPIALPLAVGLAAVVLALLVAVAATALSMLVAFAAAGIGGLILAAVGLGGFTVSFSASLLLIGLGLILAGVSAALCWGVILAARAAVRGIIRWARKRIEKRRLAKGVKKNA